MRVYRARRAWLADRLEHTVEKRRKIKKSRCRASIKKVTTYFERNVSPSRIRRRALQICVRCGELRGAHCRVRRPCGRLRGTWGGTVVLSSRRWRFLKMRVLLIEFVSRIQSFRLVMSLIIKMIRYVYL